MAIISKDRAQEREGGHYYRKDGSSAHHQERKDGKGQRNTTIKDAREQGLLPSVTTILGCLNKGALTTWKVKEAIAVCYRSFPQAYEPLDAYQKRVIEESMAQVGDASDLGTRIHDALERAVMGDLDIDPALMVYVAPVLEWFAKAKITPVEVEKTLVNTRHGYAGKCDFIGKGPRGKRVVIDFKSRKTKPNQTVTPFDGQSMQIAAYAATAFKENSLARIGGINVYISTTEPGRVEHYQHPDLVEPFQAFKHVCAVWRHLNGYDPREAR
jgi:hypothetical protein